MNSLTFSTKSYVKNYSSQQSNINDKIGNYMRQLIITFM